jgi:hypothetical protein
MQRVAKATGSSIGSLFEASIDKAEKAQVFFRTRHPQNLVEVVNLFFRACFPSPTQNFHDLSICNLMSVVQKEPL